MSDESLTLAVDLIIVIMYLISLGCLATVEFQGKSGKMPTLV